MGDLNDQPLTFTPDTETSNVPAPTLEFNPIPPKNMVPQAAIPNRAAKIDFTLGDASPGITNISSELQNNGDQQFQKYAADKQALDFEQTKTNMLNRMITTQNGPVTDDQANFVRNMTQADYNEVAASKNPMETEYARKYMSTITARNIATYAAAEAAHPEVTNAVRDVYEDGVTRNQIAQKALDDIQSQQQTQGFWSGVGNFIGSSFPLAGLRTNNAVVGAGAGGLLPGENLQHQIVYLHTLPPDQFDTEFHAALDRIKNLNQKQEFAQAVISYSDFDVVAKTAMAAADAAGIGEGVMGLSKTLFKGAAKTAGSDIAKGSLEAAGDGATSHRGAIGTEIDPYQRPNDISIPGKTANDNAVDNTVTKFSRPQVIEGVNDNPAPGNIARPSNAANPANDTRVPGSVANNNEAPTKVTQLNPGTNDNGPRFNDNNPSIDVFNANQYETPDGRSANTNTGPTSVTPSTRVGGIADNDNLGTNATTPRNSVSTKATDIAQHVNDNRMDRVFNVVSGNDNSVDAVEKINSLYRGALEASKNPNVDLADITEKTGDFKTSAMLNDAKATMAPGDIPDDVKVRQNAHSINGGANQFFSADSYLGREATDRLRQRMLANEATANSLFDHLNVDRDTVTNQMLARDATYDAFVRNSDIEPLQSSILDVQSDGKFYQTEHSAVGQTEAIHIHLGMPNGELFPNRLAAEKFMEDNLSKYNNTIKSVYPTRGGYAIRMTQDVPDAINSYADMIFQPHERFTEDTKNGILKGFLGAARNQSNVLGEGNAQARKNWTHGQVKLYQTYKDILQPLEKLKGQPLKELMTVMENNRDFVDRVTGDRGMFYDTVSQFEDEFNKQWGHMPSEQQTAAYFAQIQANDLHYMVLSYSERRDKIARGIKAFENTYTVREPGGVRRAVTHQIEGQEIDRLPLEDRDEGTDFNVAYKDPDTGQLVTKSKRFLGPASTDMKKIEDIKARGGKIIQIADQNLPIEGVTNGPKSVGFYVSDGMTEGRVSADSSYKPGGHVVNKYDHYIKQPIIDFHDDQRLAGTYRGDISFRSVSSERLAKKLAEHLEVARKMMNDHDPKLDEYVSKNLGEGYDGAAFRREFEPKRTRDGVRPGLDPTQPFVAVRKGQRTGDVLTLPNGVLNTQKSKYNLLRDLDRTFTGERDSYNIPAYYEENKTLKVHNDGNVINPLEALTKAARNISDRRLKHDYVMKSANQWVQQFQHLLEQPWEQLSRNPRQQLMDPQFKKGGDPVLLNNAMNSRNSILRFAGIANKEEGWFDTVISRSVNMLDDKLGEGNVVSNMLIPFTKNPAAVARSVAFHAKLGLFNPIQYFLQAQTLANVLALSPRAGIKSAAMALPMRMALINPSMLEHSAGVARAFGWKSGHFEEMMNNMMKSGWHDVHGTYAALDDLDNPKLFRTAFGKVLDAGATFFNEGERTNRMVSFATSYLEWKEKHPTGEISNRDLTSMLSRADDLTVNMSSANNAVWQKGIAAIPAQFQTYQMRLTEQYLSKTLTTAEKARLFAFHSALFGIPTAAGGAAGIWPIYQSVKAYMIDNQIPYDDNATQAVLNGIPQMMLKSMTGLSENIGERYGTGGASMLRDLWTGKENLGSILLGSSGSIGGDILSTTMPSLHAMWDLMSGNKNGIYPLDQTTLSLPFRDISSVNNAFKLWTGMNQGKWLSKQGLPVDHVTDGESALAFALGVTPERIQDQYIVNDIQRGYSQAKNEALKMADNYWTRADALPNGDPQRAEYMKMAKVAILSSGGTQQDVIKMMTRHIINLNQTQHDRTMNGFHYDAIKRQNAMDSVNNGGL